MKHAFRRPERSEEELVPEPTFPMRINKYLAWKRQSSRRDMDKIVEEGRVWINGSLARNGSKVNENDHIEVRFHGAAAQKAMNNAQAAKRRSQNYRAGR